MATKKFFKALRATAMATCLGALGFAFVACEDEKPDFTPGPESGVYYCDVDGEEYLITLSGGNTFALAVDEDNKSGVYTVDGETLTLDFYADEDGVITASLSEGVMTFTYGEQEMRFLKKVPYTVSFEENGGSEVADVSVINGKTVEKPADPTRPGYGFIGWYADAEHETPYLFGTQVVTGNVTIYAKWGEKRPGAAEYVVDFETGAEDVAAPEAKETTGGVVYNLPTVEREGYTFEGWWISDANDAEKLTCRYEDGMVLTQDTTLFAVWTQAATDGKLDAPVVEVKEDSIRWNAVKNAANYQVEVVGPKGFTDINTKNPSTIFEVDFANAPEGEYLVKVTALAASAANNSETTVRYFTNKALSRVSHFTVVEPSVINFVGVENAENYFITVVCGNEEHNHTMLDNGASTNYSFLNCDMKEGGIEFTVTATAKGYASSTSQTFTYERTLDAVEGLYLNEKTQTLVWSAVPEATNYMVSVKCGNADHNHALVDNGGKTSYCLKECEPCEGGIKVEVYPVTKGYNTPAASSFTYEKTALATPSDLRIVGNTLTWSAVNNVETYEVKIGDRTFEATENSLDLTKVMAWVENQDCTISVRAKGEENSLWSDTLDARYFALSNSLEYSAGVVSWRAVIGAAEYEVKVNDGRAKAVTDGKNAAAVTLTKAGKNTISVRFFDGEFFSKWVSMEVFAYTVEFDARLGASVADQYKALGDPIELPTTTKPGYDLAGWYNAPGGAAANAAKFTDGKLTKASDMVVYAYWTAADFTVTYNKGGDIGASENLTTKVTYGEGFKFDVPTSDDETIAFAGWYSSTTISDETRLTNERGESLGEWNLPQDSMVYAYWAEVLTFVEYGDGYAVQKGPGIDFARIVTIPVTFNDKPVVRVEAYAFKYCYDIKEINIPNTVEEIELNSFYVCSNLEAINVYEVEGAIEPTYYSIDGILIKINRVGGSNHELMTVPAKLVGDITIPEGVTTLPSMIFSKSTLTSIVLPSTLEDIQYRAFYNCPNLTEITILDPESGTPKAFSMVAEAIELCPSLTKVNLPARTSSLATVEESTQVTVFKDCVSLGAITIPAQPNTAYKTVDGLLCNAEGNTVVYCPFGKTGPYTIPSNIGTIGELAFANCNKITELVVPNTVSVIGTNAFAGMKSLTKVTFQGDGAVNVTVGEGAFANCANLTTVEFTGECRVKALGASAFANCTALTGFVVPESVVSIGNKAFENCLGLTAMNIPVGVESIALGAFEGCDNIENITVADGNVNYVDDNGALYEKDTANNVTYNKIIFYSKKKGNVTLPAETTTIGDGVFANNENITTFTIGVNVTTVGKNAFDGCVNLAEVIFTPVTPAEDGTVAQTLSLGDYSFANCTALTEFEFPKHAKKTGNYTLYKSTNVAEVTFLNDATAIGSYALAYTAISEISLPATLTKIPSGLFQGCKNITQITLPAKLTEIGARAFQNAGLTTLELPTTVTKIGANAFENAKVTSVSLPSGLTVLDAAAFQGSALTSIKLPASLTTLGESAFAKTTKLSKLEFEDGFSAAIAAYAFQKSGVTSVTIPANVVSVGGYAFDDCTKLATLTFEDSTKDTLTVGDYAFRYTAITTVTLPDRLAYVSNYMFYYCKSLKTVNISENSKLSKIGGSSFMGCDALESIFIPRTVMNTVNSKGAYNGYGVGTYAFAGCDNLTTVTFQSGGVIDKANGKNGISFSSAMFASCPKLTDLTLPDHLDAYSTSTGPFHDSTFDVHPLLNIIVNETNANYKVVDDILYTIDGTTLVRCPTGKVGEVTIPAAVTAISNKAFAKCTEITKVTFEESTEALKIGNNAFDGCTAMTDFTIPTRVTTVGTSAFKGCVFFGNEAFDFRDYPNWTDVGNYTFQNSNIKGVIFSAGITSVGTSAFNGCAELSSVDMSLATFTKLSDYTFRYCDALTSITIGASITEIGREVFDDCTNLATIEFAENSALTKIGREAFNGTAISTIVLPDLVETVTYSGTSSYVYGVFDDCPNLRSVTISKNLGGDKNPAALLVNAIHVQYVNAPVGCVNYKSVNGVLYSANGDTIVWYPSQMVGTNYTLANNVTNIAMYAFMNNPYLQKLTIPDGLTQVGEGAFRNCTALGTLSLPKGITVIPKYMALDCTSLYKVTVAGDITAVNESAFDGCVNLESINLPLTVTTIAKQAFYECGKLDGIQLGESLTSIGDSAFGWCVSMKELFIPKSVKALGSSGTSVKIDGVYVSYRMYNPFIGMAKTDIQLASDNPNYVMEDGILYLANKTQIIWASNEVSGHFKPQSCVRVYANGAFANCENIVSFTANEEVVQAGSSLLQGSGVRTVTMAGEWTKADTSTFKDCTSLREVKNCQITSNKAFSGCTSLTEVTHAGGYLYAETYAGCTNLKKVTLPKSFVKSSGVPATWYVYANAFTNCPNLEEVVFYASSVGDINPGAKGIFECLPETCTLRIIGAASMEDMPENFQEYWLGNYKCNIVFEP